MTVEELYKEYKLEAAKAIKAMQELRDKMEEEQLQAEKLRDIIANLKRITSEITILTCGANADSAHRK